MKKYLLFFLIFLFSAPYIFSAESGTIKSLHGKVEIKSGSGAWEKAENGMEVKPGTLISTGFRSEAVLDLGSSEIQVKQLTRMSLDELSVKENTVKTNLNLRLGRIKADVKTSAGLKHDFTLRTPVSTAAVKGTVFTAGIRNLAVENGRISFTNRIGQVVTVSGGSSSVVTGTGYSAPENAADMINSVFDVETSTQTETGAGITTTADVNAIKYGSVKMVFNFTVSD